ncbi:hypothetical protein CDAR_9001 [Caerostris darwini]|uniref:Uncharacterized protein n=1 Tax=Caerostris darwini TaxID=1538125 RepID=A0AAV4MAK0_9ARAC|nr:hypothetical protein CDAR_9001 [Caerostris darwini]
MSEDVTSRFQTIQVDDDDRQADQSIKKAYIPPIIVDDPVNGKQLLEDLNHLTNEAVTGRVIGNKLKIFPPSDEAHRAIRREISDESAPTSLQNTISTNSVKMDKSPPNQLQPQLSGPSTSSSTPQENLTTQLLQSLVKEVHVLTSNIASLLAALQSQSPLSHSIQ